MSFRNNGGDWAIGTRLVFRLPAGVRFVSARPEQARCEGTTTVTCRIGTLFTGEIQTLTLVVRPTRVGTISSSASSSADVTDQAAANNSETETTRVVGCRLAVSPGRVLAGSRRTLSVTVRLAGDPVARAVVRARGAGVATSARTGGNGVARLTVTPTRAGRLTVTVPSVPGCRTTLGVTGAAPARLTGSR